MPLFFFKLFIGLYVLAYMGYQVVRAPIAKLQYGKNLDAWIDRTIQRFAAFCMKMLRVDLTIENQAVLGKVDWKRPVFVVGNHGSFADIPIVFLAIERTIGFVAKKSLGRIPFLNFWMHRIGCILVDRKKGGAAAAVREAMAESGKTPRIFIFPEGTRSKNGQIGPFKSGAFRFAYENNGIVLPLVISGSAAVWESRKDTKPCKVKVRLLEPVDVKKLLEENPNIDPKRDLATMVRQQMVGAKDGL